MADLEKCLGDIFWIFYTFLWLFLHISIFYNAFCIEKRKNLDFPFFLIFAQCLYNFYGLLTLSSLGALFKYFMYRRTVQNISIHLWNWTYNFSLNWTKTNHGLYKHLHERHLVSKWKFLANSWIALFQVGEASPHRPQVPSLRYWTETKWKLQNDSASAVNHDS